VHDFKMGYLKQHKRNRAENQATGEDNNKNADAVELRDRGLVF
jgi:hypothetical protein